MTMTRFDRIRPALLAVLIVLGLVAHGKPARAAPTEELVVAGGCFWCVEADFEKVQGVSEVVSGYTGGNVENPSYKQVTSGGTGHYEAARIQYDPNQVSLDRLLDIFFRSVDPTDAGGQFCDRGNSYRTAIFPDGPQQMAAAEKAKAEAEQRLDQRIVTPILKAGAFYEAEEYHQDYYKKDDLILSRFGPITKAKAYDRYRDACGRDDRLRELWGSAAYTG